ncbi:hypothetical protein Adt_17530 [Abeliophyllum distichum]|uniref:Uncharacterized protein n=1 Tax=Abeliophyllum distichum TaxID=126358 RepID=A0ABD1TGV2_9LAMI
MVHCARSGVLEELRDVQICVLADPALKLRAAAARRSGEDLRVVASRRSGRSCAHCRTQVRPDLRAGPRSARGAGPFARRHGDDTQPGASVDLGSVCYRRPSARQISDLRVSGWRLDQDSSHGLMVVWT